MKSSEQPSELLSSLFSAGVAVLSSALSSGVAPVVGASVFAGSASSSS